MGRSLAVRLPKALVEKMGLKVGDELNIVDVAGPHLPNASGASVPRDR
jgi:antitoxin component of MazEF toxin-antitoxin module